MKSTGKIIKSNKKMYIENPFLAFYIKGNFTQNGIVNGTYQFRILSSPHTIIVTNNNMKYFNNVLLSQHRNKKWRSSLCQEETE